jgi:hypothetical protein
MVLLAGIYYPEGYKKRKHRVAVCYPMFSGGEKNHINQVTETVVGTAAGAL